MYQIAEIIEAKVEDLLDIKAENIYNQTNNYNAVGHQEVQNLYQDNKEVNEKFIKSLQDEVVFLRKLLWEK